MNKQQGYVIDFVNEKIILTKKLIKTASVINSKEYNLVKQLRMDYAGYAIEAREIAKKEGKKSYANLTYDAMRQHITITEGKDSVNLANLENVIELSKGQAGRYAYVKTWFLKKYPNYSDVNAAVEKANLVA